MPPSWWWVWLLLLARLTSAFYIEILWFQEVGQADSFWKRTLWTWAIRGGVMALAAGLAWFNLRQVANTLGAVRIRRRFANIEIAEQLPRAYIVWSIGAASALFGLWFGAAVPRQVAVDVLLWLNAPSWGLSEPIFGRDAGFFVFALPLLLQGLSLALALVFLLLALCLAGYSATGAIRMSGRRPHVSSAALRHLGWLAFGFFAILAVRLWLARYILLISGTSGFQGIFGYTDLNARLPALQGVAALTLFAACTFIAAVLRRRVRLAVVGGVTLVLAWLALGQVYPALVQRFRVEPNELERETRFIEYNLEWTRRAFGLSDLERRPITFQPPSTEAWTVAQAQFEGLPVWRPSALLTTYRELEARFRYYDFPTVAIDRYEVDGRLAPVAVSVREVDPRGIEDPSWQNQHLRERYVRGLGAVASLASRSTPVGRPPMLLSDLPRADVADTPPSLQLERDAVFYGTRPQPYAIITPTDSAFRAQDGSVGVAGVDYPQGIEVGGLLRRLALAWRFRDTDLLFSDEVSATSRFAFRRQVTERIRNVAPMLTVPSRPYPVIHEGRVVWISDAYTHSRSFPVASRRRFAGSTVNYVRNSVKAVVDGVTGQVQLYVVDAEDPIVTGLSRSFPGLFLPLEEMPEGLKEHLLYPKELFRLQSEVLYAYHQETAPELHGQRDVWTRPDQSTEDPDPVPYEAEYGLYTLPGDTEPDFLLTGVFVPNGRQNLTALLVARSSPERYGELLLLDVPVEDQIPGPRQVESLIEQDPTISGQFSLWRQGGSKVWLGHLHLVPAAGSLLYMEPIFLAAEADAIPELTRFIVSDGRQVAMTETLGQALLALGADVPATDPGELTELPSTATSGWSADALATLERAEAALRVGDFAEFGRELADLKALLQQAQSNDEAPPPNR